MYLVLFTLVNEGNINNEDQISQLNLLENLLNSIHVNFMQITLYSRKKETETTNLLQFWANYSVQTIFCPKNDIIKQKRIIDFPNHSMEHDTFFAGKNLFITRRNVMKSNLSDLNNILRWEKTNYFKVNSSICCMTRL